MIHFQKRQYLFLADVMRTAIHYATSDKEISTISTVVHVLADALKKENPNFDRDFFLSNCDVPRDL